MTCFEWRGVVLLLVCCGFICCGGGDSKSPDDAAASTDAAATDTPGAVEVGSDQGLVPDAQGADSTTPPEDGGADDAGGAPADTGGAEAETVARADPFKEAANWSAFDAGNIGGLKTMGYFGVIYDGRYVYHAPCKDSSSFHGRALAYDTEGEFNQEGSWSAYDAADTDGLKTIGYAGGAYDGQYVYYAPFTNNDSRHAEVLRDATESGFDQEAAWSAHDASSVDGLKAVGFVDAVFDGRYIYFSPFGYEPMAHGRVLRFDSEGDFDQESSWAIYDAGFTGGLVMKGFYGLILEGHYIYFVPFHDGGEFHGRVLRYDSDGEFDQDSSWAL